MEYLSQVDNIVEVLSFLLSKIQFNQDLDDLDLVKKLSTLNSTVDDFRSRTLQSGEEEGELVGFTKTESQLLETRDDKSDTHEENIQIKDDSLFQPISSFHHKKFNKK